MSLVHGWDDYAAGRACPFDPPRAGVDEHLYFVRALATSSLYLERNQTYRGHCVLLYDRAHVVRIDQLAAKDWAALAADLHAAVTAVCAVVRPDHVNVESLGMVMPHLHWHVVPRYKTDPRWGGPIWIRDMPVRRLAEDEYADLARQIGTALDHGSVR